MGTTQLNIRLDVTTLDETRQVARAFALEARGGDIFALSGELGAGKTTFARFFLQALGVEEDVPSPTFTLVQTYPLKAAGEQSRTVWHFDLYRLDAPEEAFELGIEEALEADISLIEWPEKLGRYLPADRLDLRFSFVEDQENARQLDVTASSPSWKKRLAALQLPGELAS